MCSIEEHIDKHDLVHLIFEDGMASQLAEEHISSCNDCKVIVAELKERINFLVRRKMPGI